MPDPPDRKHSGLCEGTGPEQSGASTRQLVDGWRLPEVAAARRRSAPATKSRTIAKFKDTEGANWQCEFLTDGNTLLLATLNSTEKPRSLEVQTAIAVLDSIKIVKK